MKYRAEIDGLRAVAVLSVIFYHAKISLFSGGFIGVDVFFVISGFLITSILKTELEEGRFSLVRFYERRLRRILPALIFMAVTVTALCSVVLIPGELRDFARSLIAMSTFWANIFFYLKAGYFDSAAESKPLLHTWSLSVEEQFYIFLPIIMFFLFKWARNRLNLTLIILAFISLLLSIIVIYSNQSGVFYLLHFRAWELLAGSILATSPRLSALRLPHWAANILAAVGIMLIVFPALFYTKHTAFPGFAAIPVVLGAVILIQLGPGNWMAGILSTRLMTGIGKISYPLYLWHWPMLVIPEVVLMRNLTTFELGCALSLTLILSIISWHFIEKPIRAKHVLQSPKNLIATSLVVLLLMTCTGIVIRNARGFTGRLSERALAYQSERDTFVKQSEACLRTKYSKDLSPCEIGSEENVPSFLLWGDSQAASWAPGLIELAKEYGLRGLQYTMASCAPLAGFIQDDPSASMEMCLQFNEDVFDVIKRYKIKYVCLGSGLGAYMGGRDPSRPTPYTRERVAELLGRTLERLEEAGVTRVWFIEAVPEYPYSIPDALTRMDLAKLPMDVIALPRTKYETFVRPVDKVLDDFDVINMLKISPPICDDEACWPGNEHGAYYSDFQHLSVFGARHFKATFAPMLEEVKKSAASYATR